MTTSQERSVEKEFRVVLESNRNLYAPLTIKSVVDGEPDVELYLGYQDRVYGFFMEIKGRSAPSVVHSAVGKLARQTSPNRHPMLGVPYLSEALVPLLESSGVSGIDLNGNYLIRTPDLVAIRLDQPNKFHEPATIKNVFAGNSSIIGRYLLGHPGPFPQVNDIYNGITAIGGAISLATVSKVLKGLTDELLINRNRDGLVLVRQGKLLMRLREEYRTPKVTATLRLNIPGERSDIQKVLNDSLGAEDWIWTGESSVDAYAVTTLTPDLSAYTRAASRLLKSLRQYEDSRNFTCELRHTDDTFVYFERDGQWTSRIECYLALSQLDSRARDVARDIEQDILETSR